MEDVLSETINNICEKSKELLSLDERTTYLNLIEKNPLVLNLILNTKKNNIITIKSNQNDNVFNCSKTSKSDIERKDCWTSNDSTGSVNPQRTAVKTNPLISNLISDTDQYFNTESNVYEIGSVYQKQIKSNSKKIERIRKKIYYNCKQCSYKTLCKAVLDAHTNKKHLNIRPFVCNTCYKSFYRKSNLVEHIHSHENIKELCELCGDVFRQKKSLMDHLRLHYNDRPYECNICGKKFITSGRRSDHMKRSHMTKTESCMYCSKKFGLKKELTRHLKSVHTKI